MDYAYEKYGLLPVFIPIEGRMDVNAAQQVTPLLKKAPAATLPACAGSEQAIALFSRMDVVMSMRLHALIFSAVRGVPLVGLVYDPKVSAFLDAVEQDLYAPMDQLTPELLQNLLDRAVSRKQDSAVLEAKAARLLRLEANNSLCAREMLAD